MKKILLIAVLFTQITLSGQTIPNGDFETWNNMGSYYDPQGWWTANDSVKSGTYYPVTRSTDHYPLSVGSYSIRIESQEYTAWPPPEWQDWGVAGTGNWNDIMNSLPVFPVTGHPTSLCGYYKWIPQNGDTMDIVIRLLKNGVDIGGGQLGDSTSALNWTPFQIPFSSYTSVDSARMTLACTADKTMIAHGNSVLYIDNLSFDNFITAVPAVNNLSPLNLYPDPAAEVITVSMPQKNQGNADLMVYDITGRIVMENHFIITADSFPLNISALQPGVYLVRINTVKETLLNKFVKK
ncbi:MAG: T9SS type A sorting domain-containing protein [Bacteroidia bacterium]